MAKRCAVHRLLSPSCLRRAARGSRLRSFRRNREMIGSLFLSLPRMWRPASRLDEGGAAGRRGVGILGQVNVFTTVSPDLARWNRREATRRPPIQREIKPLDVNPSGRIARGGESLIPLQSSTGIVIFSRACHGDDAHGPRRAHRDEDRRLSDRSMNGDRRSVRCPVSAPRLRKRRARVRGRIAQPQSTRVMVSSWPVTGGARSWMLRSGVWPGNASCESARDMSYRGGRVQRCGAVPHGSPA